MQYETHLGADVAGGLANLSSFVEKAQAKRDQLAEEEKRTVKNGKIADMIFDNNPELEKAAGVTTDARRAMSATERADLATATLTRLRLKKELTEAQKEAFAQSVREAEEAQAQALPRVAAELARRKQAPFRSAGQGRLDELAIVDAAKAAGYPLRSPQDIVKLQQLALPEEQPFDFVGAGMVPVGGTRNGVRFERPEAVTGTEPISFDEDPVTGSRFARSGKQVLPSGVNPGKAEVSNELVELKDADGEPTGVKGYYRRTRSGMEFVPVKTKEAPGNLGMPYIVDGKVIPGYSVYNGRIIDHRSLPQKAGADPGSGTGGPNVNDPIGLFGQ